MAIYDFIPSEAYILSNSEPKYRFEKLESRARLMDFVKKKCEEFIRFRDNMLDIFSTLHMLYADFSILE